MSKWKAGQCVTIEGKRYRVTKLNIRSYDNCCIFCGFIFKGCDEYPCTECISNNKVPSLLPPKSYLKEIKPKS